MTSPAQVRPRDRRLPEASDCSSIPTAARSADWRITPSGCCAKPAIGVASATAIASIAILMASFPFYGTDSPTPPGEILN